MTLTPIWRSALRRAVAGRRRPKRTHRHAWEFDLRRGTYRCACGLEMYLTGDGRVAMRTF